ncbi:hypothetical protein GWL_00710 [Herbaspirillum sp. GW103]|nr:hypothetical protein GWL_00710 [Herbaspirillum sp. GW103]
MGQHVTLAGAIALVAFRLEVLRAGGVGGVSMSVQCVGHGVLLIVVNEMSVK